MRQAPGMSQKLSEAIKSFPTSESLSTSKYYKGGFDPKMNKREASLILGVSPTAPKGKVRMINIFLFGLNIDVFFNLTFHYFCSL